MYIYLFIVQLWRTLRRKAADSYMSRRAMRRKSLPYNVQLSRDGPNRIQDSSE